MPSQVTEISSSYFGHHPYSKMMPSCLAGTTRTICLEYHLLNVHDLHCQKNAATLKGGLIFVLISHLWVRNSSTFQRGTIFQNSSSQEWK